MHSGIEDILAIIQRHTEFDAYNKIINDLHWVLQSHLCDVLMAKFSHTIDLESKIPKLFDNCFDELLCDRLLKRDESSRDALEYAISDFVACEAFQGLEMTSQDSL